MQGKAVKNKTDVLSIIIVGVGRVGRTLCEQLVREGHDITLVDTDALVIREVSEVYDVMGVRGNGASLSVLEDAGVGSADLIIAVTGSDELNLLCCTVARKTGRGISAIARVNNPDYADELSYLREQLGLSMIINPELEAAKEIARILSRPQALSVSAFAKGHAELMRFKIPAGSMLCGKKIMELDSLFKFGYLVCAVERAGDVFIPGGPFELCEGDEISMLSSSRDSHRIFRSLGMHSHALRSCLIIGGGKSSYYLAQQLLAQKMDVKIIERDRARCEELSALLPQAVVICGNGGDEALLKEEGIETVESFVPLTGLDEENILLTLFAKRQKGLKTVTKINRMTFSDVIGELELGSVVYPKYLTAEAIIAYVRAKQNTIGSNIETLYHLFGERVEALEFSVEAGAPVIGIPLMKLKKKDNLLIACIDRKGKLLFPRGQDAIEAGDSVIIVTTHTGLRDVGDILA